jgi:hypothetical protein
MYLGYTEAFVLLVVLIAGAFVLAALVLWVL